MTPPSKHNQLSPQNLPDPAAWHPDHNMLVAFANGEGNDKTFRRIESHLTHCDVCVTTIESLDCAVSESWFSPHWRLDVRNRVDDPCELLDSAYGKSEGDLRDRSIGPYRLKKKIGEGGMGIVYLAEQQAPIQRTVALKILKPGLTSAPFVKRFKSERQTLAILKHPNIAKVLDAGETGQGQLYFVMEFIEGVPIVEFCNDHRLTIPQRLGLFEQVCSAVEHAHQKAIIHRDLKPSNVLVSQVDGHPQSKVIDFGIAKTLNPSEQQTLVTQVGQIVGTLEYLSPEQLHFDSSNVDTRTDVYLLGAILYELLTNQPPLGIHDRTCNTIDDIARAIRERDPTLPSICLARSDSLEQLAHDRSTPSKKLVKRVRGDLDWITAKALEKKRSRRYQSARELANDVRRYLKNEPLSIPAPSFLYRAQKTMRRHKVAVGFATTLLVFTIFLTGLTSWLLVAIHDAEASKKQLRHDNAVAYVRNAESYLKDNNLHEASNQLSDLIPKPGQDDLRGFEWYYFWNQCQPDQLINSVDCESRLHDIEYSPDGSMYAVAGAGKKTATLFDAVTNDKLFELGQDVAGIAVDFTLDNRNLIVAADKGWLFVVDTKTREISYQHKLATGAIRNVAIDPMGRYVAVGGPAIWVFDTQSLDEPVRSINTQNHITSLSFSPDGLLLVASEDPKPAQHRLCQLVLYECDGWGCLDRKDAVRSEHPTTHLQSLLVMPDNQTLICGFSHGAALIWKITRKEDSKLAQLASEPQEVIVPSNGSGLTSIKLSDDQRFLATARIDSTVQIWELNEKTPSFYRGKKTTPFAELKGHSNPARGVEFLPDGHALASVGRDGRINFWEIERDRDSLFFGTAAPTAIDYREGHLLVGNSQEVICWDNSKHNIRYRIPSSDGSMSYSVEFFSVRGQSQTVTLDGQGMVRVYNSQNGRHIHGFRLPTNSRVAVNRSKQEFVVAMGDNRLRRYSFGGTFIAPIGTHDDRISRIAIGESGEIVSCSTDGIIKFWDTEFKLARTYQTEAWPMAIAYSDVNHCIAVGSVDPNVEILNTTTNERYVLRGHTADIKCLDFSADGTRLASGGQDKVVILWETKTWKNLCAFDQFYDFINCLKFSPDNQLLVVGTEKNFVWLLNAPRN